MVKSLVPLIRVPGRGSGGRLRHAGIVALAVCVTGMFLATSAQAAPSPQVAPAIPQSHLWAWATGPLGIGTTGVRVEAQPIHGLGTGPVKQVTVNHNGPVVALLDNGTVWAWGNGPLGNGGSSGSLSPVQLTSLSGITQLAATTSYDGNTSTYTIYALGSSGTVWAWGDGTNGEIGDGSFADALTPQQVTGLTGVTSLAAGGDTGYALESDGTLWAWGQGISGQLGNGTMANSDVPVQVKLTVPATRVTSNCGSAYALTTHHQVFSWGANDEGQLGDGTKINAAGPRLVRRVRDASTVVAACVDAYAIIQPAGTVMAWGQGAQGEIGDAHNADRPYPEAVSGLAEVTSVTPGYYTAYAITQGGTLWSWGFGWEGQLGDGIRGSNSDMPVHVINIDVPVVSVFAGDYADQGINNIFAVGANGSVWSWGPPGFGADGSGGSGPDPGQMPRLPAGTAVYNTEAAWFASV